MRTYNLFRRKGHAELVCAVPEDRPVPAFITGSLWQFGGKLENADRDPFAFNHAAANASVKDPDAVRQFSVASAKAVPFQYWLSEFRLIESSTV